MVESPCKSCKLEARCWTGCSKWKVWHRQAWAEAVAPFRVLANKKAVSAATETAEAAKE